jgi:hypothetical protein
MVFVFIQFAAFPVAAILLRSTVYGGLRQFMFLIPAVAMLIMLSVFVLVRHGALSRIRGVLPTVAGVLVASTIVTTVSQFQLFPYVTSYFNPTTVAGGIDGRWEMYPRKLAVGELYAKLTLDQRLRCTKCPPLDAFPTQYAEPSTKDSPPLDYWEAIRFPPNVPSKRPAQACSETANKVTRPYFGATITMLKASVCDINGPLVETGPSAVEGDTKWWKKITQWGWEETRANGVTSSPGISSALAWSTTPIAPGATRTFVLDLSVLDGSADFVTLSVLVNGIAMEDVVIPAGAGAATSLIYPAPGTTKLVIDVPAPSIEGAPDDLVVVEFVLTDGNGTPVTNSLVVSSVRLAL